jgi:hypothetical protein
MKNRKTEVTEFGTYKQVSSTSRGDKSRADPGPIEMVELRKLRLARRNARTHSKKQIRQIADSMLRFGVINPLIVDDQSRIVAGHARFRRPKATPILAFAHTRLALYTELVYQPMIEVLQHLRAHGYRTFIATGGGAGFVREHAEKVYGIVPEQVAGTEQAFKYGYDKDRRHPY